MSLRKPWLYGALVAAAIVVVAGGYFLKRAADYLTIATGYVAQQTCTCRHVSGRALESCRGDFPADAIAQLSISEADSRVSVSAHGLFKVEAEYDPAFGCRLVN